MRPPKLTADQYRAIMHAEQLRRSVPTRKQLARRLGLSWHTVSRVARFGVKAYEREEIAA